MLGVIDILEWNEIMGTISGDDTLLIICRNRQDSKLVVDKIMSMMS